MFLSTQHTITLPDGYVDIMAKVPLNALFQAAIATQHFPLVPLRSNLATNLVFDEGV